MISLINNHVREGYRICGVRRHDVKYTQWRSYDNELKNATSLGPNVPVTVGQAVHIYSLDASQGVFMENTCPGSLYNYVIHYGGISNGDSECVCALFKGQWIDWCESTDSFNVLVDIHGLFRNIPTYRIHHVYIASCITCLQTRVYIIHVVRGVESVCQVIFYFFKGKTKQVTWRKQRHNAVYCMHRHSSTLFLL